MDPATWSYLPVTDVTRVIADFHRVFEAHRPRLVLFGAPDNPTSQILRTHSSTPCAHARPTPAPGSPIDFAYKCQYFTDTTATIRGRPLSIRT